MRPSCITVALLFLSSTLALSQSGALSGRYNADRRADFLHMRLELRFTPEGIRARSASGSVEYEVKPSAGELTVVDLDAARMKIAAVRLSGAGYGESAPARFFYDDVRLRVFLPSPLQPGQTLRLAVDYRLDEPARGMYFSSPGKPVTIYTMGESLEARHWLPSHDWPNERWTSDIFLTVPTPLQAVSIGELVAITPSAGSTTYHWRSRQPADAHLSGLVIGDFVRVEDRWRGKPVVAYVPREKEAAARYSYRRVPEILEFYSQFTGVDYPYPAFTHAAVLDHFHRGMEHAGLSMMDPSFLAEGPGRDGFEPTEPGWPGVTIETNLIAHMLAHNWFAGIVNYRNAPHAWLNEGFATYMHFLWTGKAYSEDVFLYLMRESARLVALADTPERGQSMVPKAMSAPTDPFHIDGGKIYWKGAWFLHMLRRQLGEETFRNAVRQYLEKHRWGGVETSDLRRTLEEASGRDLERTFDQWVYGAGIPNLRVRYRWDPQKQQSAVRVEQTQKITDSAPAFFFPLELYFRVDGKDSYVQVQMDRPSQEFTHSWLVEPTLFAADPKSDLLAGIELDLPALMLHRIAKEAPDMYPRLLAVRTLAREAKAGAVVTLEETTARNGEFWGVRAAAAEGLARLQTPAALASLLKLAAAPPQDPRSLGWLLNALSRFPYSVDAHRVLNHFAAEETSDKVRAMALRALGIMRGNPEASTLTLNTLIGASRPFSPPLVQVNALWALGAREDEGGFSALAAAAAPGREAAVRGPAMLSLARLGRIEKLRDTTRELLLGWLSDPDFSARMDAASALGELGDPKALPALSAMAAGAFTALERERASGAISRLGRTREARPDSRAVLDRLAEMERQNAQLRQKIEELSTAVEALQPKQPPENKKPEEKK